MPNSHKVLLGIAEPTPERARRRQNGISRHGARTVRNAAYLMEKKYGVDRLSFLTCTLPRVDATAEYRAGLEWAEIIRVFKQGLTRLLSAAGLPPTYVGCTEIQMKRYAKYGGMPLHLHLVLPGRQPFKAWAISADQYRELWRRAVVARCPEFSEVSFSSAVDCQRVKSSAQRYLGKYMSKGAGDLKAIKDDDPGICEFLPAAWWCCSANMREAIKKRITGGNATARKLARDVRQGDTRVDYATEVKVEISPGEFMKVAIIGRLSPEGRSRYCWSDNKEVILGIQRTGMVASID